MDRTNAKAILLAAAAASLPVLAGGYGPAPLVAEHPPLSAPASLVQPGAEFRRIATGYQFTEGPAPDSAGGLYFTDVFDSKIYHWTAEDGAQLYRADTERTNGLRFDADWRLVGCVWYGQRLIRDDTKGNVTVLADEYDGKRLNGPNDVWIAPNGRVYFTDPTFDNPAGFEQDGAYVYFLPPEGGALVRASDRLALPNGLVGTPDGSLLYVTDSQPGTGTFRYAISPDGTLADKTQFTARGGDGMDLDESGNVYLASSYDVWIHDPSGTLVERIRPPEPPANVSFGGPEGRTLFVTAYSSVYAIEMTVRGAYAPPSIVTATPTPEPCLPTYTPTPTGTEAPPDATPLPDLHMPYASRSSEAG